MSRLLALVAIGACAGGPRYREHALPRSVLEGHTDTMMSEQIAVRAPVSWKDIVVVSRRKSFVGALFAGPSAPPPAQALAPAVTADPEKLVIEAWLELQSDDIAAASAAIRAHVEEAGGRVISENVQAEGKTPTSAALELRVPPLATRPFLAWVGEHGAVTSRRELATDVSKQLFDQELALQNLRLEMTRLQELAKRDVAMTDLLAIEKEMTRVRGDLERIEGEQRFLLDRVAFATVTVTIRRDLPPSELAPHARVYPGAHVAMLSVLGAGARAGGGAEVLVARALTFQLDVFPRAGSDSRAVLATIGAAMYSGLFGYGRRTWGNPYLGVRAGYGYISGENATVFAAEAGLEIFKRDGFIIGASAAAVALLHDARNDAALHATLGLDVPF